MSMPLFMTFTCISFMEYFPMSFSGDLSPFHSQPPPLSVELYYPLSLSMPVRLNDFYPTSSEGRSQQSVLLSRRGLHAQFIPDSVNVVPQLFPQFGLAINEALHVSHLSRMRTNKKDQESIECLNACACTKRLSRK